MFKTNLISTLRSWFGYQLFFNREIKVLLIVLFYSFLSNILSFFLYTRQLGIHGIMWGDYVIAYFSRSLHVSRSVDRTAQVYRLMASAMHISHRKTRPKVNMKMAREMSAIFSEMAMPFLDQLWKFVQKTISCQSLSKISNNVVTARCDYFVKDGYRTFSLWVLWKPWVWGAKRLWRRQIARKCASRIIMDPTLRGREF